MWILHFLPDSLILWVTNILLGLGIVAALASLVVHKIPLLWRYQLPAKIAAIVLLVAGVYLRGGYGVEMAWRERVAEVEARLKIAEEASREENVRIETKYVDRVKVIQRQGQTVIQYVDREIVKYDTKFAPGGICEIPREFIKAHNDAAERAK